jgi:hypothetical protein
MQELKEEFVCPKPTLLKPWRNCRALQSAWVNEQLLLRYRVWFFDSISCVFFIGVILFLTMR